MHPRLGLPLGFVSLLGGVFLLAFTQVTRVFIDPRRTELGGTSDTIGDVTWVFLSAILLAAGLTLLLASVAPARGGFRALALTGAFTSTFLLLILHLTLFINSITVGTETELATYFTASYLFHTGDSYSVMAVFLILLITLAVLAGFVASVAALLAPRRFREAIWDPEDWDKNESTLVSSSLLLVFALTLFFVYLVQISVRLSVDPPPARGFFANTLPVFYYLQIFFVGALILTVAARVFLVNWGTRTPLAAETVLDSLHNTGRVERVLAVAAIVFNLLILLSPPATDEVGLSTDPVFLLDSRGLAWFFFLLAIPYAPYAVSQARLRRLLDEGEMRAGGSPFSERSLRLVLTSLGGLVLLSTIGVGARWTPLGLMIALSAWMSGVLLFASVRLRLDRGTLSPQLRGPAAAPYFFGFLILSLATGIMMWGAGNTYVATYLESGQSLTIENASPYGADILFRVTGAALLAFTLLLPLAILKTVRGIRRSLLVPHVLGFSSLVVLATIVFTVGVWNTGTEQGADALAGFAFHQYYLEEKLFVAGLVLALGGLCFWSLGRIVGQLVKPRTYARIVEAVQVR